MKSALIRSGLTESHRSYIQADEIINNAFYSLRSESAELTKKPGCTICIHSASGTLPEAAEELSLYSHKDPVHRIGGVHLSVSEIIQLNQSVLLCFDFPTERRHADCVPRSTYIRRREA